MGGRIVWMGSMWIGRVNAWIVWIDGFGAANGLDRSSGWIACLGKGWKVGESDRLDFVD
jgi:hypothetical protein